MQNKLDENIENVIIAIVSKKIAPIIGLEAGLPEEIVIEDLKKLRDKGTLKIGFITEGELISALTFISATSSSKDRFISLDVGIEVSIDPETPQVFKISKTQYSQIISKVQDIGRITVN